MFVNDAVASSGRLFGLLGAVPDSYQRDSRAAKPREAVICVQRLPQSLPGDGCGPQRLGQGAAAGRAESDANFPFLGFSVKVVVVFILLIENVKIVAITVMLVAII